MKQTRKKHGAAFKAKVALAAVKGDRTVPSWRAHLGFIRTRSTAGKSSCWTAASVFEGGAAVEGPTSEAQVDLLYRQIGQLVAPVSTDEPFVIDMHRTGKNSGVARLAAYAARQPSRRWRSALATPGCLQSIPGNALSSCSRSRFRC